MVHKCEILLILKEINKKKRFGGKIERRGK